jgi:hypothetical protein
VLLASPAYDVVYDRTRVIDGVNIAAPSQVAVDLMTGSGRNSAQAEALLEWMETDCRVLETVTAADLLRAVGLLRTATASEH